jgi:carboxyl-terminal processing protease
MGKIIKYTLFGGAFIVIGLLVGFKIKDSIPVGSMVNIDRNLQKLQKALLFIERNYVEEPDHDRLVDDAIQGILKGLDPHSIYIPAEEMKQKAEEMEGSFDGIGIQFNILEDTIYVETPLVGGPSEKLGIQAGDRIIKVDGKNVAGIDITIPQVMRLLKGPKGSTVQVSILRREVDELITFNIERDHIPIHSVDYAYMVADQVGYISVTRFAETTYAEFKQALNQLLAQGMEGLILDLRGNPGGYMTIAYKMADEFLEENKMIVSTEGRTPESKQSYYSSASLSAFEQGSLVILMDYGSASASEIVSGAVQDHDRGLIVGVRSFGKGLVQIQEEFEDGSAVRIVVSKYYTPSGRCIQKPYHKSEEEYAREIADRFASGEIFDESKVSFPDSLKHKTAAGRTVYGGGGIFPDVFVPGDTSQSSKYLTQLRLNDLFRRFSFEYVDARPAMETRYASAARFVAEFEVTPQLEKAFIAFAKEKEVPFDRAGFEASQSYIRNRIKAFIGRRLFKEDGFYPVAHEADRTLQRAIELMPVAQELEQTGRFTPPPSN